MAGGYGGFYPVTSPMELPVDPYRSPYGVQDPELPEVPNLGVEGVNPTALRIQAQSAKALPPMKVVDSGSGAREREAAFENYAIGAAFGESKVRERASRNYAKAKGRAMQRVAERGAKHDTTTGVKYSQYGERRSKAFAGRGAQNLTGPSAFPVMVPIR